MTEDEKRAYLIKYFTEVAEKSEISGISAFRIAGQARALVNAVPYTSVENLDYHINLAKETKEKEAEILSNQFLRNAGAKP